MSETSNEAEVRALLAPLRADRPRLTADRASAIWGQIEARQARSQTHAVRWVLAAAAVIAVGGAIAWTTRRPENEAGPGSVAAVDSTPADRAVPERVVDRSVTLLSGATLDVAGEVRVATATQQITRLTLTRGSVTSRVPTLPAAGRFVVDTPAAEIEVQGTVFTVALLETGATQVRVDEGRVAARARDGRQARAIEAGETVIIEPTTASGADRAASRGDLVQAFDIRRALIEREPDDLGRSNRLLSLGRAIDDRAVGFAVPYWQRVRALHPTGVHADEFAWRYASALRAAGRLDAAREAAARYRARFPNSPRAAETRAW